MSVPRVLPTHPAEIVVYDEPMACPYLAGQTARMPMRLPTRGLRRDEMDRRLASGDRRQGLLLYRTACEDCQACEPIRLDVDEFSPSRSQRRALERGDRVIDVELGAPRADRERVTLYNRHKRERGLETSGESDLEDYRDFLVHTCCDSIEFRYRVDERLVGIAVADRGRNSLSAVYCFFDPDYSHLSVGVFSIMKQVEVCQRWGLKHLYLGLYIADSDAMAYKARYLPHERLDDGQWVRFERAERRR